jgi:hypothetical protein
VVLHTLPTLWSDSRIREVNTDNEQNKYGYLYNVYYPEDPSKPPVGVVYHKEKFHQFYHSTTTGNPYLGDPYKEANHFELFKDNSSTEAGGDEQLTLQICNTVVLLNLGDLGSPERTREVWAPDHTPTLTPTTYTAQQEQSRLPMATETITRTLASETQHKGLGEPLHTEGPEWGSRPIPFGADRMGSSWPTEGQICASIINAFWRRLHNTRWPPDDDDNGEDYGPPGGGGGDPPDQEPNGNLQDHIPIPLALEIWAMGSLPRIFDEDRTKAEAFLTKFLRYLMLNHGILGLESPIWQVALALMLIKGEKVDLWVKNMIDTLRCLHPVQHNVPAVWNKFEKEFHKKFIDLTSELHARNQLDKLKFKYPDIDRHIAEFKDLIVKANYNLVSQEAINLFLKGFSHSRNLLDKVFTPPVPETYKSMKRRMVAIVKSMQLVNLIAQNAPNFRPFQRSNQPRFPQGNQQPTQGFAPWQVNSSNTPPWMRNMPVPMDTSNHTCTPGQRQAQNNAAQAENLPWRQLRPWMCFNYGKEGHFQAQCCAPRKTQINSVIDEPEDMANIQEPLSPEGILDNMLAMFDHMPD